MEIKNCKSLEADGTAGNSFVGIKIHNNEIEFHYPKTYKISSEIVGLRRDILSVLRTVSLAKTKTRDTSEYNTGFSKSDEFPLSAYLWIINDYLTYGRYENREKVYVKGSKGKINWKKTLHSNPVISEGNIIYTDIISEQKNQIDNLITEIYYYCVQRSVDAIGWIYGLSFDSNGIDYYHLFNRSIYLTALNTELSHTFDDQKKIRLQNMKSVVTGLDNELSRTKELTYGVDSYDYVFERMIDSMFSNINNIKEFYPSATWELVVENEPQDSSNLRPDTIIIKDNKVYIIDAKYYRYGLTFEPKNMPETTSIQKQITYGEYVKKVYQGVYEEVYSAFILPYSKYENDHIERFNSNMEFIGIGKAKWMDSKAEKSRNIAAILIDMTFLINNWINKDEDNINYLISLIEKNVGEKT